MTPPQAQPVSTERPLAGTAIAAGAPAGAEGPFVINLRSSTTPMALSQPSDPALARFKFFMSRRLEDGRERFRLHMGFFETLAEAEEWLAVVREIYPGAWAGEAPGKRLKARAPEPAGAAAPPATLAGSPAAATAAAVPPPAASPRAAPAPQTSELQSPRRQTGALPVGPPRAPAHPAAPHGASAIPSNVPVLRPAAAQAAAGAPPARRESQPDARGESPPPAAKPTAAPKPAAASKPAAATKPPAASKPKTGAARLPLSNVREVLAALDETGATRQMPALAADQLAQPGLAADKRAQPEAEHNLSDTQVLKLLESRRADGGSAEVDRGISLLKPEDTGTRRALKEAVATNAPVSFAVQLQWSVQSIDISKVPPLAIFSAYTLYTVEGSREGRRWYGLRLGFFSDAISAKQVAHYVRSEFNSVAVVPVSPQERGRASEGKKGEVNGPKAAASPLRDRLPEPTGEFKLIDDEPVVRRPPPAPAKLASKAGPAAATAKAGVPAKRGSRTPAGRVRARDRRSPETLEETLEILGADQLEIDQGSGETLNDTGVRHLSVQVRKNTPFTRLLDRLAERARGR